MLQPREKSSGSIILDTCKNQLDTAWGIDMIFDRFLNYFKSSIDSLIKASDLMQIKQPLLRSENIRMARESNIPTDVDIKMTSLGPVHMEYYDNTGQFEAMLDSYLDEELYQVCYKYPSYFRSFFLIQIFSFMEDELANICESLIKVTNSPFSRKNKKGSDSLLEHCLNYLINCKFIDKVDINDELYKILTIKKLRNYIVHENSIINTSENSYVKFRESLEYYQNTKMISLCPVEGRENEFEINFENNEFVKLEIENVKKLFKKILIKFPIDSVFA